VESFLPDMRQRYVTNNLKTSEWYRQYNSFVPEFLGGRPRSVIIHCLEREAHAKKYDDSDVVPNAQNGVFTVLRSSGGSHTIIFVFDGDLSCTCKDWRMWRIPCTHFFSVFRTKAEWGWNSLPYSYLQSAYLSCDERMTTSFQEDFADFQSCSQVDGPMASNCTDTPDVGEAIISCSSLEDVNVCGESQVIEESADLDGATKSVEDQNH